MFPIVRRREMAQGTIVLNEIEAPLIAAKTRPGQFVILKATETGERIPLTVSDTDADNGTITIIYMIVGKTTALFAGLAEGDAFTDVIGPLGKPTPIEKVGTVVCVGGGTGTAVLYPITRALKKAGNRVISIVGSRNKDLLILEDEMRAVSDDFRICTDDGSYGHHGLVTEVLEDILEADSSVKLAVAIGPVPMMKFCALATKPFGVKTLVSLNPIMVDGTGMCGCCRVSVGGQTRFACVDGPEFDGHAVDFDELSLRLRAYLEQEKISYDRYGEKNG